MPKVDKQHNKEVLMSTLAHDDSQTRKSASMALSAIVIYEL